MDLNDKIAARRREIEEAKQKQVEAEQRLQRAELHRQQQAARMAKQEAEVKAPADAKAAASQFKPATPIKTVDIEGETELLNESIGLMTKKQWALFIGLAFWAVFNLFTEDMIRVIVFCALAIGYLAYIVDKHRKTILMQRKAPLQNE